MNAAPDGLMRLCRDLLMDALADEHRRVLDDLPRWQRVGHWLLVSWHCPACKHWRETRPND